MTTLVLGICDGNDCREPYGFRADDDRGVAIEKSILEAAGWFIDHAEDFFYCPKCAPIVRKEMEQDNE